MLVQSSQLWASVSEGVRRNRLSAKGKKTLLLDACFFINAIVPLRVSLCGEGQKRQEDAIVDSWTNKTQSKRQSCRQGNKKKQIEM